MTSRGSKIALRLQRSRVSTMARRSSIKRGTGMIARCCCGEAMRDGGTYTNMGLHVELALSECELLSHICALDRVQRE